MNCPSSWGAADCSLCALSLFLLRFRERDLTRAHPRAHLRCWLLWLRRPIPTWPISELVLVLVFGPTGMVTALVANPDEHREPIYLFFLCVDTSARLAGRNQRKFAIVTGKALRAPLRHESAIGACRTGN